MLRSQNFHVFVPGDCDDDDDSAKPYTNTKIPVSSLLSINPIILPEERKAGYYISTSKDDSYVSVKADHGLTVGDYLVVRGKNYRIVDIHPDDGFTSKWGSRNLIFVDKPFQNNVKRQAFRLRKMRHLFGRFVQVSSSHLCTYRGFSSCFKSCKSQNNHGEMELKFSCAVFNSEGFFTRNLAIAEEDMCNSF